MRIAVLNQHYWPETAATAQLLEDVCEDLAAAGHEVTVVAGQPSYRPRTNGESALPVRETHKGVSIRRVWSYAPVKRTIPKRVFHYGAYFAGSLVASLREAKPDAVMVLSTPPLLLGVSGAIARMFRGVPFVYSVQDLYPDVAVNLGVLRPGATTRMVDAVAKHLYRSADHVITLSDAMAERLADKGVGPAAITVIPNWADTDAVRPHARDNAFAREHGLEGRFVVQYAGNVGLSQGLEHMLDAAAALVNEPVLFAIVGDGNAKDALVEGARSRGLANVRFLDPQPRDRLNELLASSDVGLVPMKRGVASDLVPSKLYGILAAGRPVLASVEADSEVGKVVRNHACGVVVPPEDGAALADAIRAMIADGARLHEWGTNGRRAAERHFSRRVCTDRYRTVLESVVAQGAAS